MAPPSLRFASIRIVWMLMFSEMNRTRPSPNRAFTPPGCPLNGSSFGPQLLLFQVQVGGPPSGVLLLLITETRVPEIYNDDAGSCVGGPEMPLPLSGSAQRFGAPNPPPKVPG